MKTIKFTAYLFYRYYSTGATKDIPYVSILCAMVMLLGLHVFQIVVLFDLTSLLPTKITSTRGQSFLLIALLLMPVFFVMSALIKKSDLQKMHYERQEIKRGNLYLIIYVIASILAIPAIVFIKKGHL